jgi:hypothetical protein
MRSTANGRRIAAICAAAAFTGAASADITFTLDNTSFSGWSFSRFVDYSQFNIVGTLTGASIDVVLDGSVGSTYADDLCVYVDVEPVTSNGLLQIGGYSSLQAAQRHFWPNGGSSSAGTTSIGTVNLASALAFSGNRALDGTVWIGNGFGNGMSSGTWTGTVTLHGVNAVPIPAPGALALLGAAAIAARWRRR